MEGLQDVKVGDETAHRRVMINFQTLLGPVWRSPSRVRYGVVLSLAGFGEAVEGGEHRAVRRETAGRCEGGASDGVRVAVSAVCSSGCSV